MARSVPYDVTDVDIYSLIGDQPVLLEGVEATMRITINDGVTFLITNEVGDVPQGEEAGLYYEDTRFLSCFEARLDNLPLVLLASRATEYNTATYFLTNPLLNGATRGTLGVVRRQRVGPGMTEDLTITNYGDHEAFCTLSLALDADFEHLFEVKSEVEVSKNGARRRGAFSREERDDGKTLRLRFERDGASRDLRVRLSQAPERSTAAAEDEMQAVGSALTYPLRLAPRTEWTLQLDFSPSIYDPNAGVTPEFDPTSVDEQTRVARHAQVVAQAPTLTTDSYSLTQAYEQSVQDFAALQIVGGKDGEVIIAAGIPWFMTLFGRDSLIAAFQSLFFYPHAAKGVLRALARLQGDKVDILRAEEPGKMLHEYRSPVFTGTQNSAAVFPYYGTIDATPLFLMLLAAVYRVDGDLTFVRSLREHALRALDWMDRYGDRDGDGYLEYIRLADAGLENQGWKDSGDSIRYHDGSLAKGPIALCEVQGYAYAARMGMAEVFDALGEGGRARGLRAVAAELKQRFNRDFWMSEQNYFAEALDGEKRQVNSVTSNPGHLLWTGIIDDEKVEPVVQRLLSPELFSGWGIRTMATTDGGYNPISYHCGSVWPHDNSLIVAGLARYGYIEEAANVSDGLLSALRFYEDHRLPELFAGYSQKEASFPVEYPTSSRPQAWASCTVFLLLSTMLGLNALAPDLHSIPFLPAHVDRLRLDHIWTTRRRGSIEIARERSGDVYLTSAEDPAGELAS